MSDNPPMRVLLSHQNFPGQFKNLAPELLRRGHEVLAIHRPGLRPGAGIKSVAFQPARRPSAKTHRYLQSVEAAVLQGQTTARAAIKLRNDGYRPDVIASHAGWGESLFLSDVFPAVPHLGYFEFFYHATGSDVDFDRPTPPDLDDFARLRVKNAPHLMSFASVDWGLSPTVWQKSQIPPALQSKVSVLHEGVDCVTNAPDPGASLRLPNGNILRAGDPVITYVSRYLEPYRGFPSFMAAMEQVLTANSKVQVLVVGEEQGGYGRRAAEADSHKAKVLADHNIDAERVHFMGRIPYETFTRVLQVSSVHVYLTYPFVLSWSMLEAMAAGCLVVASDTAPVTEIIEDGKSGLLVDFHDPGDIARSVLKVLEKPKNFNAIRAHARDLVLERFDSRILAAQAADMLEKMARGEMPPLQPVHTRPPPKGWRPHAG